MKTKKKSLKNFMYFLCFYNLVSKNLSTNNTQSKTKILCLPKKIKKFTLLRAPFRHKLSKKNYTLIRYKSCFIFSMILSENFKVLDTTQCLLFFRSIISNLYWFETNIQYIHRIDLSTDILLKKYKL